MGLSAGGMRSSILTWAPIVISFIALGVSSYEFYDNHRRTIAQDTPRVEFEEDTDTDDSTIGLKIANLGSAIARLKSVTYYVDRKPIKSADDVLEAGKLDDVGYYEFDDDSTLAIGEGEWLLKKSTKVKKGEQKDIDHFIDFIDHHLAVGAEVCSITTKKCETICSTDGWCK